ncbi:MAG: hypothetical protein H7836_12755, partial [Magnetococcus sp. YQC-3]
MQIGKYDEAINRHKENLKKAVDNDTSSWKALASASASNFDRASEKLDDLFEKRRSAYQADVDAYLSADQRKATFLVDRQEQEANARKYSQRSVMQVLTTLAIQEASAKIAEGHRYLDEALAISQREYQTRFANAKRLGLDEHRVNEERLQDQRKILEKVEASYKRTIDNLISEEKRHRDAARQLAEERKRFNDSMEDRKASVAEKMMSPTEVYLDRQRRILAEQQQAQAALDSGNFAEAKRHSEKLIALAEQTSDAVVENDQTLVGKKAAATRAMQQMAAGQEILNEALQGEEAAHLKSANALRQQAISSEEQLRSLQSMINNVDATIAKEHRFIIQANTDEIKRIGPELDELVSKKERAVKVKLELQQGAEALDTVVANILKGATAQAQKSLDDVSRIFGNFKSEFAGWQPEVKAEFQAQSAIDSINGLMGKYAEFKERVPQEDETVLGVETAEAFNMVQALIDEIAEVQDKTVTITVVREDVGGGGTEGFARGGHLPGWGGGDRIHALLEAGEFVLNKHAVRRYGVDRLHAINQMRLPQFAHGGLVQPLRFKMPEIPRFEFGGLARRLAIPVIPPMEFAGGGSVSPPVEGVVRLDLFSGGRPVASIPGPRQQIRQLVDALKELDRGVR